MKSTVKHIFRFCLAMVGLSGCQESPPVFPLDRLVATSPLKSPPLLVTGSTDDRFLASFEKSLYVWDREGQQVGEPQPLPFTVRELFPTASGALAVGREGFIPVGMDGRAQAPIGIEHGQEGIYWAFAIIQGKILVVSADMNKELFVQTYERNGKTFGLPITFRRPQFGTVLAASAIAHENFVLVWEEDRALYAAIIAPDGQVVKSPFEIYAVGKGGALQRGSAQPQGDGGVLVAWQDSSPGPWSVMTLLIKPDGTVDRTVRLNPHEKTDATKVCIPHGGSGRFVAWISGMHWGAFSSVSGQGHVAWQELNAQKPQGLLEAKGSIEASSMAMYQGQALALGAVRQASAEGNTLGYDVFSTVVSLPSLGIEQ